MGYTPIPPPRRPTALEQVREQYVRGERDVEGLERGVEWLMRIRWDDSLATIQPEWPTTGWVELQRLGLVDRGTLAEAVA